MSHERESNTEQSLNNCAVPVDLNKQNIDPVPKICHDFDPTQKRVGENPAYEWRQDPSLLKGGPQAQGQSGLCDPMQTGQIVNETDTPNREVVYRYTQSLRGANEAMFDLFRNTKVLDEEGKAHTVPIIWATQEKAVAFILQDNIRKDNTTVVDRIRLPIMAIYASGYAFDVQRYTYHRALSFIPIAGSPGFTNQEKAPCDTVFAMGRGYPVNITYNLYVWTMYQEDMEQILEQIMLKFSPVAYLRIRGVRWEVIVTLDSAANNFDMEPGDQKLRVLKYQFTFTAKSYIPQPLMRFQTPLVDPFTAFDNDEIELLEKLKENVEA